MPTREEVLKQALELSPADRGLLCFQLDESLIPPEQLAKGGFATPELAAKWSAEIDRRIEAMQRGEIATIDRETATKYIRDALEASREQQSVHQ